MGEGGVLFHAEPVFGRSKLRICCSMLLGLGACVLTTFSYGSIFVPIKKCGKSDGFMAQFFMAVGGFLVSLIIHALIGFPPIYPIVMFGGALWCTANAFAVLIMNRLGMALGILIWSSISCIMGWATSRFGWFGLSKSIPNSQFFNYFGILILLIGSSFYLFIKSNVNHHKKQISSGESGISIQKAEDDYLSETDNNVLHHVTIFERILSIIGATICGLFYGSFCTPVTYVQNHPELYPDASQQGLPYIFSFFCGILPTSTIILVFYSFIKKNNPEMPGCLVLPSMLSGTLFCIGTSGFFIANERLSQAIAYPICSFAPALVVSAWSVFYFKEITGKKNLILLSVAYVLTFIGVGMVTISKTI